MEINKVRKVLSHFEENEKINNFDAVDVEVSKDVITIATTTNITEESGLKYKYKEIVKIL